MDHAPFIHHRHIQIEMNREGGESYLFIAPVNIVVFGLIVLSVFAHFLPVLTAKMKKIHEHRGLMSIFSKEMVSCVLCIYVNTNNHNF